MSVAGATWTEYITGWWWAQCGPSTGLCSLVQSDAIREGHRVDGLETGNELPSIGVRQITGEGRREGGRVQGRLSNLLKKLRFSMAGKRFRDR